MYSWSHPNSIKWSWETGHLRWAGDFTWGSAFTGSGRKIGWEIVMLKMGWVIKLSWRDSTDGENDWIFGSYGGTQSSSRENPDMYVEKS